MNEERVRTILQSIDEKLDILLEAQAALIKKLDGMIQKDKREDCLSIKEPNLPLLQ